MSRGYSACSSDVAITSNAYSIACLHSSWHIASMSKSLDSELSSALYSICCETAAHKVGMCPVWLLSLDITISSLNAVLDGSEMALFWSEIT